MRKIPIPVKTGRKFLKNVNGPMPANCPTPISNKSSGMPTDTMEMILATK